MTTDTKDYLDHNGFLIAREFHRFMEQSVITSTSLSAEDFWQAFYELLTRSETDKTECTQAGPLCEQSMTEIPVSQCNQTANVATSWGSLYQALYTDNAIPHSAGLKPGTSINAARRDRVIHCAKDFLDKTYPLTEGSHRDALSYMVYFQNLLVILADGSTTGLQNPNQYAGKNGPRDKPDSILLEHNGIHTEILFDCNGHTGCKDLAAIDDIQLESAIPTLFNLNADTVSQKCSTYDNWMQIVKRRGKTFSNRLGENVSIDCNNWAITTSANDNPIDSHSNALVLDQQGYRVPEAIIDVLTAAVINSAFSKGSNQLNVVALQPDENISDCFIAGLQQMLALTAGIQRAEPVPAPGETRIKVFAASADNPAQTKNRSIPEVSQLRSPATEVLSTMRSHGYDVKQTASM